MEYFFVALETTFPLVCSHTQEPEWVNMRKYIVCTAAVSITETTK
jgi:hypothetical protein